MTTDYSTDLIPYMPQGQAAGTPERSLNIMRMLRLRLPLMAMVFLPVALLSVAGIWLLVPQEYTASEKLQFVAHQQGILENDRVSSAEYEKQVFTSAALVNDAQFLLRVLSDPRVRDLQELREQEDKISYLKGRVVARLIPRTEFLEVSGTFGDRQTATVIVTVAVEKLEELALQKERESQRERFDALRKQEEDLQAQYNAQMQDIWRMREKVQAPYLRVDGVGTSGDALQASLTDAQRRKSEVENQISEAETQLATLRQIDEELKGDANREVWEFGIESQAMSDREVSVYLQQTVELKTRMDNSPWAENTQAASQIKKQMDVAQSNLTKALRDARRAAIAVRVADAERRQAQLAATQKSIESEIDNINVQVSQEREKATSLVQDEEAIKQEESKLTQIEERLWGVQQEIYKAEVESKRPPRVNRPSEGAMAPVRPDHGKQMKLAFLAIVAAGGLGLGAGLLREMTDQQLHGSEDVTYVTHLPVLAAIPHTTADRLPSGTAAPMVSREFPNSTSAEEFRRILSRIIYPPEGAVEIKTILVTSPAKGDGKTSLACNLATALAQANRRVLVVDVSARRPGVERAFGLEPGPGLTEVLAGECTADEAVQHTEIPGVVVMGPGMRDRDLTGKLASRQALEFFEQAEDLFDHVIIDTPPCLLMSDAKLLAPVMDGVVMVVGVGVSTTGMMRRCLMDFQQGGAHVLGIVVNGVRPTRGGYLRRNLADFYSYGDESVRGNGNGHGRPANGVQEAETDEDLPMILLVDERAETEEKRDRT